MAGWYILDVCTFGISAIFYSNMYRMAVMSEFYTLRRKEFQSAILMIRIYLKNQAVL